jgi:lipooligosaccharide transport system permease protein
MILNTDQPPKDKLAAVENWPGLLGRILTMLLYTYRVWQRNRDVFLHQWAAEVGGFIVEPFIMLAAMGFGLGGYVGDIQGVSYAAFVAPGILVAYAMFHSSFEATYGVYMRMETHRLFDGIVVTPVSVEELVLGEAVWAATRSILAGISVLVVATLFGLVHSPLALLSIPVAFITGVVFASLALMLVSVAPSIGTLNNFFTIFITPMFFFSGIFFPLERFPTILENLAWLSPLTHSAHVSRGLMLGQLDWGVAMSSVVLGLYATILLPICVVLMRRRLVK